MTDASDPNANRLLSALPRESFERLRPHLALVHLSSGETVYEPGGRMRYVYFLTTAIVSKVNVLQDGATTGLAIVGNEGLVGIARITSGGNAINAAITECAGNAYRLLSHVLQEEFHRDGAIQAVLLPYVQALLTQIAQTAVCNRMHSVSQQLSRMLLMCIDRSPTDELSMTQESIARLLGVRREGVTEAACKLQRAGVIRYTRGHISVVDRASLRTHACECYAMVQREYQRLLPVQAAVRLPRSPANAFRPNVVTGPRARAARNFEPMPAI